MKNASVGGNGGWAPTFLKISMWWWLVRAGGDQGIDFCLSIRG